MRPYNRIGTLALLVLIFGILINGPSADAKSLTQLRQKFRDTSRSIHNLKTMLRTVKKKRHVEASKLIVSQNNLDHTRTALKGVRVQLTATQSKLAVTRHELAVVQKRLNIRNRQLSRRIVDTYRHGNVSYLSVILGASDMSDLLDRTYAVSKVVESDTELIDSIKDDKRSIEKTKRSIEAQERSYAALEREKSRLEHEYNEETYQHKVAVKDLDRQRREYEAGLAAEAEASARIFRQLQSYERTPQGRSRLAHAWHGNFLRPVNGRITSGFGMRYHPVIGRYKMHTGVDLACPIGTPIHAAGSGVVILAGWYGAYGNAVMIDHGGGVVTLYGHQSRLATRPGQSVTQGQIIGYSGSTGWSTGPHCHFEVRKHGIPVNPL